MEKLEALFALYDVASGPAKKITGSLKDLYGAAKQLGGSKLGSFFDGVKGAAAAAKPIIQGVGEVVGYAYDKLKYLALGAAAAAAGIAKMAVEATETNRKLLAAMEVTEGTAGAAQDAADVLDKMAELAGQDDDQLKKLYVGFRRLGYGAQESRDIIAAMLDVKALGGDEAASALQGLFDKLEAGGEFKPNTKALASIGISKEQLAQTLSTYDQFKGMTQQGIIAAMDAGQISADVGMQGILDTINTQIDKGAGLGSKAKTILGDSFSGGVQRLKNAFGDLIENVDLQPLIDLLGQFTAALKSDEGKAAIKAIVDGFSQMGPLFKEVFSPGNIHALLKIFSAFMELGKAIGGGFLGALMKMLGPLRDVINLTDSSDPGIQKLIHGFKLIGEIFGFVVAALIYGVIAIAGLVAGFVEVVYEVGVAIYDFFAVTLPAAVGAVGDWFSDQWKTITDFFDGIYDAMYGAGANLVQGLVDGITGNSPAVGTAVKGVGDTAISAMKGKLDSHSPSRVFADMGEDTVYGYYGGVDKAANDNFVGDTLAGGAIGGAMDVATGPGAAAGGGGAGGGIRIENLIVQVVATPGMGLGEAEAQGHAIGRGIRAELVDELELAATGTGG